MEKVREFHVRPNCSGMTVFHFLRKVLPRNRSDSVVELIKQGFVERNGAIPDGNDKVRLGDYLSVNASALMGMTKKPKTDSLELLYRDETVICVDKPAGLSVNPDGRQKGPTAVQYVRNMFEKDGLHPKPIHRLDKWTSGVLLLATEKKHVKSLGDLFSAHKIKKTYLAFVRGRPDPAEGVVDIPIGPNSKRMTRIIVNAKQAKPAVTHYRTIGLWQGFSLVEIHLETGRTHQIRVHMSHIGHPVVCDSLYGGGDVIFLSELKVNYKPSKDKKEKPLLSRQGLHASRLEFESPESGKHIAVEAPFPHDFALFKNKLDQYGDPAS